MQTPTTTTRENSGAPAMISSIIARHPDALEDHGVLRRRGAEPVASAPGVPPADRQRGSASRRRRRRASSAVGRSMRWPGPRPRRTATSSPGSMTTSAPHARRQRAASGARNRWRRSCARPSPSAGRMTASPTGPQPITIATVRFSTSPRRTACQPTAIGSVSAATSGGRPFGTGEHQRLLDEQRARRRRRARAPTARSCRRRRRCAAAAARRRACPPRSRLRGIRGRARRPRRRTRGRRRPAGRSA